MKIIRVECHEFETEDGTIYPIEPPLQEKMELEEFEKHYGKAAELIKSLEDTRSDS